MYDPNIARHTTAKILLSRLKKWHKFGRLSEDERRKQLTRHWDTVRRETNDLYALTRGMRANLAKHRTAFTYEAANGLLSLASLRQFMKQNKQKTIDHLATKWAWMDPMSMGLALDVDNLLKFLPEYAVLTHHGHALPKDAFLRRRTFTTTPKKIAKRHPNAVGYRRRKKL